MANTTSDLSREVPPYKDAAERTLDYVLILEAKADEAEKLKKEYKEFVYVANEARLDADEEIEKLRIRAEGLAEAARVVDLRRMKWTPHTDPNLKEGSAIPWPLAMALASLDEALAKFRAQEAE